MSFWSWLKGLFHHEDAPVVQLPRPEPKPVEPPKPVQTPKAPIPVGIWPRTDVTTADRLVEYAKDMAALEILPAWADQAKRQALLAQQNQARYAAIADRASAAVGHPHAMPWYVPAVLAMMESHIGDWAAYLGNGDKIIGTGRKSVNVPAGRGPFATWEEGALDALTSEHMKSIPAWDVPHLLLYCEDFNGQGYFHMHKRSPYLFSGTNLGVGVGKYIRDGIYDQNAVSDQLGISAVLKAMGVT